MDTQYYKLPKIFPHLSNVDDYEKIKIDVDSYKYITSKEVANLITKICCKHLLLINKNPLKSNIMDYTAGVGGNVLSFSNYFQSVIAVEINVERYHFLLNNIGVYNCNNITCINDNAVEYNKKNVNIIKPDIIFIDIPWGSLWNKSTINYRVGFDIYDNFEDFIIDIFNIYISSNDKLVILKLPKNYDIKFLYNYITQKYKLKFYLYILHKMIILVIK